MADACFNPYNTGKTVAVEVAYACGDVDPLELEFAPIGAMRGKTLNFGGDTGDTTTDSTVGDFRETGMLFKTFEFSGDGLMRRDDGLVYNQTKLKMFWINTSNPAAWFRFTMEDMTIYAYMLISGVTLEFPYDDYQSYSLEASATASDFGVLAVPTPGAVTGLTVEPTTALLEDIGDFVQLVATTEPAGAYVEWESSDSDVATVSAGGVVTAVSEGVATITASVGSMTATADITVVTV